MIISLDNELGEGAGGEAEGLILLQPSHIFPLCGQCCQLTSCSLYLSVRHRTGIGSYPGLDENALDTAT